MSFAGKCDRNLAMQSNIFRSHSDGIPYFSVWGQDVISVSRNKIALTSLARPSSDVRLSFSQLAPLFNLEKKKFTTSNRSVPFIKQFAWGMSWKSIWFLWKWFSYASMQIGHQQLALQNLYSADRGMKHKDLSVLSTIAVLPLSRLFMVGTEDGFLKICH